jgi:hypothetical protein
VILWLLGAVVVLGGAVGGALYYLQQQTDTDDEGEGDTDDDAAAEDSDDGLAEHVPDVDAADAAAAIETAADVLAGTARKRARWRMAGAVLAVVAVVGAVAYVAAAGWGTLAAILFVGALIAGATGPPAAILTLREGIPLGGLVGQGLAIAAQIAFGAAALVRRDDGRYEWTVLRERGDGYIARLADGREVPIDADAGELYAFGFGRLAVTEQKTEANLRRWMVAEGTTDGGTETRAGIEVAPPQRETGGILVSLATIQRAVRGSASSTLVRRGRDKALDEEGGEQGVSQLWTMAFATILLIVGFGMTFVALSL